MIHPEHYTDQDKKIYDDFFSVRVSQVGNEKDYELYMFDINSKRPVVIRDRWSWSGTGLGRSH